MNELIISVVALVSYCLYMSNKYTPAIYYAIEDDYTVTLFDGRTMRYSEYIRQRRSQLLYNSRMGYPAKEKR